MGIQNRQRRAAKARQRAKQQARREARDGPRSDSRGRTRGSGSSNRDQIRGLLHVAATEVGTDRGAAAIDVLAGEDVAAVDREAEGALLVAVSSLWELGWQPAELVRQGKRADARLGRLVAIVVAADHVHRDPRTLHPRWANQLASLGLPSVSGATGWLGPFGSREALDRPALLSEVASAVHVLYRTPRLPTIVPPPGASLRSLLDTDRTIDDPVLVRVRALLAQAESTTFEAEAETFTAKAQQLMARHAIDAAMLWSTTSRDERPITMRLPIDDPYADIKSYLLQLVAGHARCTAVWDGTHALSTVVGFASDVASAEMLFTSLLVQSQAALQAESAKAGPGARSRSRGFRSSFLMAFTHRIDQRLAEITTTVERAAAAEATESLLPVLASRDDAVKDTVAELFGPLGSSAVRGGSDAAGWARGALAADLAKLNAADLTSGAASSACSAKSGPER